KLHRSVLVHVGERQEIIPVRAPRFAQRQLRGHVQSLALKVRLVLRRADLDAEPAARAIFDGDLDRVTLISQLAPLRGHVFETGGRVHQLTLFADLRANGRVWTDHDALAARDT